MGIAAPSYLNPAATEDEAADSRLETAAPARRAKQRRHIQDLIGISYIVDAVILLVYAQAGIVPLWFGPAYALAGLALIGVAIMLSESGINERFNDHYMVVPQSIASMMVMMAFAYIAPQVGVLFLCSLFTVFSFVSLRTTPGQTAAVWTAMALALAGLFLLTDKPIAMPHGSPVERFATMLVFTLTIGRCMFLGLYSSSMQASLYQSRSRLKEAYRRIEELAELDELTGSFNRRCIMRMLDEEITRSARSSAPCSIALIDLDHFKRVNDTHGHPTGDEVLRTFAITVFANIRSVDRFGRYGGEEFLLLLPDLPNEGATLALDRLRAIVADLDWSAFSPGMKVTFSAGVATLRPGETTDSFLARADSALYAAKAQGRNRIARA
ncbi:MAG: GGDEF domain-containing protein [Bradyrhizobium sp.]|uniref:sensor domain-containing diguanylate cyclase n=1 Tax=Bradyrhizobium sp. TaxID=376 RepID=UPI003D0B7A3C